MSSHFSLQKPYVVAPLPRPIDHTNGRYVVGEVYGGTPGTKKRKRAELAVGIDGEGVNVYDISPSRLITSYALPPQSTFTCPPTSLRTRISKFKVERRTYVSTKSPQPQITLFQEYSEDNTPATSSTVNCKVENPASPIVYLGTITPIKLADVGSAKLDLLSVKENGEIQCYDGETLQRKWTSPSSALTREDPLQPQDLEVEFVHQTNAYSVSQGLLKGRQDVLAFFPQEISQDGFNPEVLVIVSKSVVEKESSRTLHVVSLPRRATARLQGTIASVDSLLSATIPSQHTNQKDKPSFSLQASAGILQILAAGVVTTYDLSDTLPKEQSKLVTSGAQSFLRLSSTSVMVSAQDSVTVYNPKYQSRLAHVQLEFPSEAESLKRKRTAFEEGDEHSNHACSFITYFPKLGMAVGIANNNLIAIQVEGQQDRFGRPRAAGLLIDSLCCAVKERLRSGRPGASHSKRPKTLNSQTLSTSLPCSLGPDHFAQQKDEFEELLSAGSGTTEDFDKLMLPHLGATWNNAAEVVNGVTSNGLKGLDSTPKQSAANAMNASDVDRRWSTFALSKIFGFTASASGEHKLTISFYPPKTFMWLLDSGHMTATNIETATRSYNSLQNSIVDGQLVDAIVEVDPDMDLLLALLTENYLSAADLLHAIKLLMGSFGLLENNVSPAQGLLTNGDAADITNGNVEEQLEKLEAEAEKDLELAEYQLGPGSGIRGEALSLALSKLYTRPNNAIIHALQTNFTNQEIVSLIYLLRFELARGAWTTRYADGDDAEMIDEDVEIPDNSIVLISSLLNSCVDAIGAGGWLTGEARLVDNDPFEAEELIASLKLEVSAALEGIEEAAYLKGLTSEIIRYGDAVQKGLPQAEKKNIPIILPTADQDVKSLPLGLKAQKQISLMKVGAGGAVQARSMRDIGGLKSRKVGKYTRERIVI